MAEPQQDSPYTHHDPWTELSGVVLRPDGTSSFPSLQDAPQESRRRPIGVLRLRSSPCRRPGLAGRSPGRAQARPRGSPGQAPRRPPLQRSRGWKRRGVLRPRLQAGPRGHREQAPDVGGALGRGTDWLKRKCSSRQEFVIGGFTEPETLARGPRRAPDRRARGRAGPAPTRGRVGTGFDTDLLRDLRKRLDAIETRTPPFVNPPARTRDTHWVKPKLVAEVSFTEWTQDGLLRHPSFAGLREDKPAREVVHERPVRGSARKSGAGSAGRRRHGGRRRHHASRQSALFAERKLTKLDVARYMAAVAERMAPQVEGRPLMLLRCPEGRSKDCFFQKHPHGAVHPSLGAGQDSREDRDGTVSRGARRHGPRRPGARRRARGARVGRARRSRASSSRARTAWCSTSIPILRRRGPRCRARRSGCARRSAATISRAS